jgi:SAM-dependent methyltransferase
LRSSIEKYRHENGRTYHAYRDGKYLIPNDEEEQDRLDLLHHLFKMVLEGELYTAPLSSQPQRILDVGTGTGIWAIEMGERFPTAIVIGTDLSPIQPNWVPSNVKFYVDDAEADWPTSHSEKYDLVHGRALCGGISDWPRFYTQAYESLKPGGWMEMQDHECWINSDDGGMERAPGCADWIREVDRASRLVGKPLNIAHLHKQWMIDAGFQDVREVVKKVSLRVETLGRAADQALQVPIGPWAKDPKLKQLGALFRVQMTVSIPSFMLAYYTRILGHTREQTEVTMALVRKEFHDRTLHLFLRWHFVTGRRPAS